MNRAMLAMSHIIEKNPIIEESNEIKKQYLKLLRKYLRIGGWNRRKYVRAQMEVYAEILEREKKIDVSNNTLEYYKHYLLLDIIHILGYDKKTIKSDVMQKVIKQYYVDFPSMVNEKKLIKEILAIVDKGSTVNKLTSILFNEREHQYVEYIYKNVHFIEKEITTLMVTATMSAGKSTFINALTGKYISLSQNMSCTSKIHSIIGKPFEDGYSYEYDHDLVLMASKKELLNDNELNNSDRIIVSTFYDGELGGNRVVINDSPGINFSGDSVHRYITESQIKGKKYNLLIYLMNATQLGTNDEDEHLEFVKKYIGRTPIIFVINKIDAFDKDEENIEVTVENQIRYLQSKGFKKPIVCPVSSRAGYLAKVFQHDELSKIEKRELECYIDKFEDANLVDYYNKYFPSILIEDEALEEKQIMKNCGIAYVEKIIKVISEGGNIYGTNICKI